MASLQMWWHLWRTLRWCAGSYCGVVGVGLVALALSARVGSCRRQAWRCCVVALRCFARVWCWRSVDGGPFCILLLSADAVSRTSTLRCRPGSGAYQLLLMGAVGLRTGIGFGLGHGRRRCRRFGWHSWRTWRMLSRVAGGVLQRWRRWRMALALGVCKRSAGTAGMARLRRDVALLRWR